MKNLLGIAFYAYAILSYVANLYHLIVGINAMNEIIAILKITGVLFPPLSMIVVWF